MIRCPVCKFINPDTEVVTTKPQGITKCRTIMEEKKSWFGNQKKYCNAILVLDGVNFFDFWTGYGWKRGDEIVTSKTERLVNERKELPNIGPFDTNNILTLVKYADQHKCSSYEERKSISKKINSKIGDWYYSECKRIISER